MQSPYNGQIKSPILLAVIITIYRKKKKTDRIQLENKGYSAGYSYFSKLYLPSPVLYMSKHWLPP